MLIGLTGPSGSGKTTLCEIAEKNGFFVINADLVVREVYKKSTAKAALKNAFGQEIFCDDQIDRKKLASLAFKDSESTELLNKTVLPIISEEINSIIEGSGSERILLDAPTLFESGLDKRCDFVISVLSDREKRKERILLRDGISLEDAERRLSAAKSDEFYLGNSTHVVFNNGDINEFQSEANTLILNIINNSKGE